MPIGRREGYNMKKHIEDTTPKYWVRLAMQNCQ